eukprot:m.311062 g.311062  ORF g.311062 m.311062 type:complete len:186 (+) comp58987_c0_seq1:47-604(+)
MDEEPYGERIRQYESASRESSDRSLRLVEDSLRSGSATASELYRQGDALNRTERRLDDIDEDLNTSQRYIRSIKSVFSGLFSRSKPPQKPKTPEETQSSKSSRYDTESALKKAERLSYDVIEETKDPVERNLAGISRGLGELKTMAEAFGCELNRQDPQIKRLTDRVETTQGRIQAQNREIRKLF